MESFLFNNTCASQSVGPTNQLLVLLIQTLLTANCAISPPDLWPEDYGLQAISDGLEAYDFVVVGAGSAGSAVAGRLSENPNSKILLLEAGGNPPSESEIPNLFFSLQHTAYDWAYTTQPTEKACAGMRKGICYWPRGKLLGGSSAINAMLYVRGNRKDFDDWAEQGNPSWGWDDVRHFFKKAEDLRAIKPVYSEEDHGRGGPLAVNNFLSSENVRDVVIKAAHELGYKTVEDFNDNHYLGYSYVLGTTDRGKRYSSAKSYLIPAKNRKNLHVIKQAHVKKLEINAEKQVVGVTFVYNGTHRMTAKVKKEAIVSAGAIGSPQLLMLSGLGPEKHLKNMKIPVVRNLAVGENLQDHLIVPLVYKMNETFSSSATKEEILDMIYFYLTDRPSTLSHHGSIDLVGFLNTTDPTARYPDTQTHHLYFRKQSPEMQFYLTAVGYGEPIGRSILEANHKSDILIVYVVLLKPESDGKILLKSKNYSDHPLIFPGYLQKDEDVETLLRSVKLQADFIKTEAFQSADIQLAELMIPNCHKFDYKSDDYWRCYIQHCSTTVYHPVGTCKMGPDSDSKAVVDSQLRVKGIKGLRVADASIMPSIVSGNTNAASIMIGEKCSDFITSDWKNLMKKEEL